MDAGPEILGSATSVPSAVEAAGDAEPAATGAPQLKVLRKTLQRGLRRKRRERFPPYMILPACALLVAFVVGTT